MREGHQIIAYFPILTGITGKESHSRDSEKMFCESMIVPGVLLVQNLHCRNDDYGEPLADGYW